MFRKISLFLNRLLSQFLNDCHYSIYLSIVTLGKQLLCRFHCPLSVFFSNQRDKWIISYLDNLLVDVFKKWQKRTQISKNAIQDRNTQTRPIWVMWWDGIDSAPTLVKRCIKSIIDNSGNHPVIIIDKTNVNQYIYIPKYIYAKLTSGNMCLANLSDYIRMSLLYKYGGLWLDSTIYVSFPIPDRIYLYSLFTMKSPPKIGHYISNYQWTSFCFGGYLGNPFFGFMKDAFECYWKKNDKAIDYLLIDYIISLAIKRIQYINVQFSKIPLNNLHRDVLQAAMNDKRDACEFDKILSTDTYFYKISWRETYDTKTSLGFPTVYTRFINGENNI